MSNEIRLHPNPNDLARERAGGLPDFERWFVERIAMIIDGSATVHEQDGGYRWMLGNSNDWWMDRDRETGAFILAYRYAHGANAPKLAALRHSICWLLGIEESNATSQ